jgi:4-hydroxybenzoate polyprenyltransferase
MDRRLGGAAAALAASCHPVPTVAVTALGTVLVAAAGNDRLTCVVAAAAVLTGQLVIGWSNDALDAARDREVGRTDKPVALGLVSSRTIWTATAAATVATVPLSLLLGWRAGVLQLAVVFWGWVYNARLKSTPYSALPFLLAFGGLPAVATLALPAHRWPPGWTMAAAGLIGVAAHFGNVLPDLDDDRQTGIAGLPHRLGRSVSSFAAVGAALGGTLVAVVAEAAHASVAVWLLAAAAVALGSAGLLGSRRNPGSEAPFYATMAIAAVDVALIVSSSVLR